jgi:multicomponent Na+:H+ antiporter subunit E
MEARKNIPYQIVGFAILWLLLSSSLSWQVILVGFVVSGGLVILFAGSRCILLRTRIPGLAVIKAWAKYIPVFLEELVKSNLDVAFRVLKPSLPINPGIVEVKTRLKSPTGRLVLANSITLTPGTLTVETKDDSLFIHWINVSSPDIEAATQEIVSKFEKYLEVIYG